jgi:hypothetical protein
MTRFTIAVQSPQAKNADERSHREDKNTACPHANQRDADQPPIRGFASMARPPRIGPGLA